MCTSPMPSGNGRNARRKKKECLGMREKGTDLGGLTCSQWAVIIEVGNFRPLSVLLTSQEKARWKVKIAAHVCGLKKG
ncbi:hypothetical protein LIER_09978 [Lithospermum erythrorhizon]|uniref:Uncharacterized protein n=1 Tax=Lithospermum erythrorhizon TaxID=34254 RepID=A0AAV3PHK5_LITER